MSVVYKTFAVLVLFVFSFELTLYNSKREFYGRVVFVESIDSKNIKDTFIETDKGMLNNDENVFLGKHSHDRLRIQTNLKLGSVYKFTVVGWDALGNVNILDYELINSRKLCQKKQ
jgi:hypothetical protein